MDSLIKAAAAAFDTIAINAQTCAVKWRTTEDYAPAGPLVSNRGAAVADGRIFRGTQDGRVLAYDLAHGARLWATTIADAALGETVPAALLAWPGMVFCDQGWASARDRAGEREAGFQDRHHHHFSG
jgi:alcohol dehydrogenase (cytochrome c)